MRRQNDYFWVPQSYEEYQDLPNWVKTKFREYTLRDAVNAITESVADDLVENALYSPSEAIRGFIKQPGSNQVRKPFLIRLGHFVMKYSERFVIWLYWKYIRIYDRLTRSKYV